MDHTGPKPFNLHAGHPALELVNTRDMRFTADPIELLPTYGELLRFTAQLGLLPAEQARRLGRAVRPQQAAGVLAAVVELREALAAVLYAWLSNHKPPPAQVALLERHFQDAAAQRKLSPGRPHLQWSWADAEKKPEIPLWKLAQSAADLLLSPQAALIKDCGDPSCHWLFLDLSKNHTRCWCDMKTCGNRMKARRYQARRQDAAL